MTRLSLILLAMGITCAASPIVAAQSPDHMLDKCRHYASKHLHVDAGKVNVKYEGQRTDGTHAVNGSAEVSNPPLTFQCSFRADGKKIVHFVFHAPDGCPADVSEADRYKYPDCG